LKIIWSSGFATFEKLKPAQVKHVSETSHRGFSRKMKRN
jgi:hypothetical protein